jgi:hypothetical protein
MSESEVVLELISACESNKRKGLERPAKPVSATQACNMGSEPLMIFRLALVWHPHHDVKIDLLVDPVEFLFEIE